MSGIILGLRAVFPSAVSELRALRLISKHSGQAEKIGVVLLLLLLLSMGRLAAREEPPRSHFKYAGGTEKLSEGCEGNLELGPDDLIFKCQKDTISISYSAITLMQYRSDISRKIYRMKVKWAVRPAGPMLIISPKQNRFFSVVYRVQGTPHIMILRVRPEAMRPYLAELDLRAEKRVEVESYEEY